jgi:hypothetical protein
MRLTIVADDKLVIVDGRALKIDLTGLDSRIHAVQWDGAKGEIEYRAHDEDGNRQHNSKIRDISPYQLFVERWHAAKAVADAAR